MRRKGRIVFFSAAGLIVVVAFALLAQWVDNGVPVCVATGEQSAVEIAADQSGGVFITWADNRGTYEDIYVQRLDQVGNILWTADGIAVASYSAQQHSPQILPDAAGGAIIAWTDHRNVNEDIYAQLIDGNGVLQWPVTDVAISTSSTSTKVVEGMVSDGSGGAIIVWDGIDNYEPVDYNVYAQRVNAGGAVQWGTGGISICSESNSQQFPKITTDAAGGAIITWWDTRNGIDANIYAQRVNAAGTKLWMAGGVVICSNASNQNRQYITSDGVGGAIITWHDLRGIDEDIYAQRVDSNGNVLWAADGIVVCAASGDQKWQEMTGDGLGGAVVAWWDYRSGNYDIYAQKIDTSGTLLWESGGLPICTQTDDQMAPVIVPDGTGGAIIAWYDYRGTDEDIYAQWIDASGNAGWAPDGVAICTATDDQWAPKIAGDGSGSAIIAFYDLRNGNMDIYAQKINSSGRTGYYPSPVIVSAEDVPNDQGGKLTLVWERSSADTLPNDEITHYSIWRRLTIGEARALTGNFRSLRRELDLPTDFGGAAVRYLPMESGYAWEWLTNIPARHFEMYAYMVESLYDSVESDPGWQYFMVSAQTASPAVYYDSAIDSGYSVDNLAPDPPQSVMGEQSFAPEGLALSWNANAESDLQNYRLYRGLSEGFMPGPENFIASPSEAEYFDGEWQWDNGYYYKVSAVDAHGNEGGYSLFEPDQITGDNPGKVPQATFLSQNFPNPFNPMTTISFGLKQKGFISLRVYDVAGRLVRTLAEGDREAGVIIEEWNGRDNSGRATASGIYFYRLVAGDFVQTRKMVMLR